MGRRPALATPEDDNGGLFHQALPVERTETQEQWARRMAARGLVGAIVGQLAPGAPITPWQVVHNLDLPGEDIVPVRAALTTMHQSGDIERLPAPAKAEHSYIARWAWLPEMGRAPSKPHHGRGSK